MCFSFLCAFSAIICCLAPKCRKESGFKLSGNLFQKTSKFLQKVISRRKKRFSRHEKILSSHENILSCQENILSRHDNSFFLSLPAFFVGVFVFFPFHISLCVLLPSGCFFVYYFRESEKILLLRKKVPLGVFRMKYLCIGKVFS